MKRALHRLSHLFLLAGLGILPSTHLFAQGTTDPHDHAVTPIGCGTFSITDEDLRAAEINTRIHAPEVYQQALQQARTGKKPATTLGHDFITEDNFFVLNSRTNQFDAVVAGLVYDGSLVRIWVDVLDTARVKESQIIQLARALDSTTSAKSRNPLQGIVLNNQEVFGLPPTEFMIEGKTDFLLTDIKGKLDQQGQVTLGFFSPVDQQSKSQFVFSNQRNMLYVDNKEGLASMNSLFGIVSHEHQHLLHYGQNIASHIAQDGDGYTFFNEGASELASIINGYPFRTNQPYLANTNVDMLRYDRVDGGKQEVDYERSMMFLSYLHEQFGESFVKNFVKTESIGIARVGRAMEATGINPGQIDWATVIGNFAVANYVQTAPNDQLQYGFTHRPTTGRAAAKKTYTGTDFETTGSISLERLGSAYYVYNTPGPMTFSYTASRTATAMAMFYKGNALESVVKIPAGEPFELASTGGPYSKIVIAFVGLSSERTATTVNWNISPLTVGVHDNSIAAGGLAVAEIAPNPASDRAIVHYQSGSGALRLEILDMRGTRVATPVDGTATPEGRHEVAIRTSDLAPGVYMLRLSQGDKVVTRPLVVVR